MYAAARALASRLRELSERSGTQVALFIPVKMEAKRPLVCHKSTGPKPSWTEKESQGWLASNEREKFRVGMVLYDLFVLDFDIKGLCDEWAREHPELGLAPAESTKKGVHVYFRRCPAIKEAGLFDGPLKDPATGHKANIDRKTITGTGTGGLLVCAPTPNYVWLPGRSLLEVEPPIMSAGLLAKVKRFSAEAGGSAKAPKKRKRDGEPGGAEPAVAPSWDIAGIAKRREDGFLILKPESKWDMGALRAAYPQMKIDREPQPGDEPFYKDGAAGWGYHDAGVCQICRKYGNLQGEAPKVHKNQNSLKWNNDGVLVTRSLSPNDHRQVRAGGHQPLRHGSRLMETRAPHRNA